MTAAVKPKKNMKYQPRRSFLEPQKLSHWERLLLFIGVGKLTWVEQKKQPQVLANECIGESLFCKWTRNPDKKRRQTYVYLERKSSIFLSMHFVAKLIKLNRPLMLVCAVQLKRSVRRPSIYNCRPMLVCNITTRPNLSKFWSLQTWRLSIFI